MFIWTKQLSVGNRTLDSEHKKLHDIINKIACSVVARDIAILSESFELLENCLCAYFAVEENIAQAVDFDFTQHKLAHQNLLKEFRRVKDELTTKKGMVPGNEKNYARSLMNYFVQHIKEDSRLLKIVLDTQFYDFNPNSPLAELRYAERVGLLHVSNGIQRVNVQHG